jgi:hypothetical protein
LGLFRTTFIICFAAIISTMDGVEKYQYRDISGSDAIRLIKVYASTDLAAQVCCELLHTSLTECEDDIFNVYTAIS